MHRVLYASGIITQYGGKLEITEHDDTYCELELGEYQAFGSRDNLMHGESYDDILDP